MKQDPSTRYLYEYTKKRPAAFSEKSDQQTADNQDQDGLEWKKSVGKSEKNLHSIKLL